MASWLRLSFLRHHTKIGLSERESNNKQPATAKKATPTGKTNGTQEPKETNDVAASDETATPGEERNYWLLKAEPESRFENGVDVRFSIDDLAAKKEPEPWDGKATHPWAHRLVTSSNTLTGIRAYAARNNLRAMKKGELAFFYHSNCKEPGIVGTMEIVQEHSPDCKSTDFCSNTPRESNNTQCLHTTRRRLTTTPSPNLTIPSGASCTSSSGANSQPRLGSRSCGRWEGPGSRLRTCRCSSSRG